MFSRSRAIARTALMTAALVAACAPPVIGAQAEAVLGRWATADNKGTVVITRSGTTFCGSICGLAEPCYPPDDRHGMASMPKVDRDNPDPTLRQRPVLGLQILHGFTYAGNNTWENGTIYDPETGNTYRSRMSLKDDNTLHVRGYIGLSLFGRTTTWTRLP